VSGNPTRGILAGADRNDAMKFFGMEPGDRARVLLVSGGSLGARSVNSAVLENLDAILGLGLRIVWQTGQTDFERIAAATQQRPRQSVWTGAFIDRMDYAYAAADLALCRAGATTIAELTRLGKPALLVPYPQAAADHQTLNARSMERSGAAVLIADAAASGGLLPALADVLAPGRLDAMARASASLGRPDAAAGIAKHAVELGGGRRG
jgi:UDP-N-acetylglucosamine--N-acetylmuramyl-(pentapeptide) pyrophosphoryl-undecaprenol N-acetylglucosamine transferase